MLENKVREMYKAIFEEMVMPVIDKVIEEESANTEVLIREAIAKKLGNVNLAVPAKNNLAVKGEVQLEGKVVNPAKKTEEDINLEADIMEDLNHFQETVSKTKKKDKVEDKKVEQKVEVKSSDDFDLDLDDIADEGIKSNDEVLTSHLVSNDDDLDVLFDV